MNQLKDKKFGGITFAPGCTNFCVFCGGPKRTERITASPSEIKQQISDVYKNLADLKKQGIKKIIISGGDPLEYKKIIELINYIKKNGFEFIQLATNGVRFSDEAFLNKFVSSAVDMVKIPLYGSKAEIHDSVTRTPGSFNQTLKGIRGLLKKAPNIKLRIYSLILQQNKNDLLDLIDLVEDNLKIEYMDFSVPCVSNNDYSYYIPFKNLGVFAKKVLNYAFKKGYKIRFLEIPYCVFGKIDKVIDNSCGPPSLGKYCQPPLNVRSSIKNIPSYRLKKKADICERCKASAFCDGFFVNDIEKFGTGDLKPII